MKSKQPASQEQSGLETPKTDELEESVNAQVGATVKAHGSATTDVSFVITGEALRSLIDERIDQKPKSKFHAMSNNPLMVGVVGVLIGSISTAIYSSQQKFLEYKLSTQQQEAARRQSFSDEVEKLRIQKHGEMWERLDGDESTIESLLDDSASAGADNASVSNNQRVKDITKLIHDDKAIVSKYSFWLGEERFRRVTEYLELTAEYALNKLVGPSTTDLSQLVKKRSSVKHQADLDDLMKRRDAAKKDLLQFRRQFLEGETDQGPSSSNP